MSDQRFTLEKMDSPRYKIMERWGRRTTDVRLVGVLFLPKPEAQQIVDLLNDDAVALSLWPLDPEYQR